MQRGSYYNSAAAIEMKNKNANLTSVITMELKFIFFFFAMLVSLYDVIRCYVTNRKNFREILRCFF